MALVDEVRQIVRDVDASGSAASVGDTDSLLAAAVIDSTAMIDLICALEARFQIRLNDDDLTPENFDSILTICDLVQRKIGT